MCAVVQNTNSITTYLGTRTTCLGNYYYLVVKVALHHVVSVLLNLYCVNDHLRDVNLGGFCKAIVI